MRERLRTLSFGALAATIMLVVLVVPLSPAQACSCAVSTTQELAESTSFAFVGSDVGRVDTRSRDFDSVLVTFAVDEWLSHSDGPSEFQAFTGQDGAVCGVGALSGQVAVFAHGVHGEASINSCGSIHSVGDAVAAFEGRVVPEYPVAFDAVPDDPGGGGSYMDLLVPLGIAGAGAAAVAFGMRHRRESQAND